MNTANQLQRIDYLVMIIYFGFVLGVLKRFMRTSSEFLSAARSMPAESDSIFKLLKFLN